MPEPAPPRHFNVARARLADLFGGLMTAFISSLFAGEFIYLIDDVLAHDADDATFIWAIALFFGPITLGLIYVAVCGAVLMVRRILQLRRPVDLDAYEIVIQRRPKHRLAWTIGQWIFIPIIPLFFLQSVDPANPSASDVIPVVFCLVFLASVIQGIWRLWRRPANTYAPIVLNADGFLDRSSGRPLIPWRDIADIGKTGGAITLTGESALRAQAASPDRRWYRRWIKRPQPKLYIPANGFEPDELYARALIRAYWLRRVAGHGTDSTATMVPAIERR